MLCVSLVCVKVYICYFLFFKQKSAYEMRISDWSSDVCSSDLTITDRALAAVARYAMSFAVDWTVPGEAIAPIRMHPSIRSHHSSSRDINKSTDRKSVG